MQLAISRLIEAGYTPLLPVTGSNRIIISKTEALVKERLIVCLCIKVFQDRERAPILRPQQSLDHVDAIAAYDLCTKTVWLLPISLLDQLISIRLGQKYEEYIIPEPTSLDFKAQKDQRRSMRESLAGLAIKAAQRVFEEKEDE